MKQFVETLNGLRIVTRMSGKDAEVYVSDEVGDVIDSFIEYRDSDDKQTLHRIEQRVLTDHG